MCAHSSARTGSSYHIDKSFQSIIEKQGVQGRLTAEIFMQIQGNTGRQRESAANVLLLSFLCCKDTNYNFLVLIWETGFGEVEL